MYIGIDSGKKGAVVVLDKGGDIKFASNIPLIGKAVDLYSLAAIFVNISEMYPGSYAALEQVNSFGMGRQTAFVMGETYGFIKMALVNCGIKFEEVRPAKWHKAVCGKTPKGMKAKEQSLLIFNQKYSGTTLFKNSNKAKREGLIDAFLIAQYVRGLI